MVRTIMFSCEMKTTVVRGLNPLIDVINPLNHYVQKGAVLSGTAGYLYAREKFGKMFAEQTENMKEWYKNPENRARDE